VGNRKIFCWGKAENGRTVFKKGNLTINVMKRGGDSRKDGVYFCKPDNRTTKGEKGNGNDFFGP